MKIKSTFTTIMAAMLFSGMSAAANNSSSDFLKKAFFPNGQVSQEMEEAIAAFPLTPSSDDARRVVRAASYDEGMSGDWRPAEVVTYTDAGDYLYKYIYYYDKNCAYYSKDQSQVRIYQSWNATDSKWQNRMRLKVILDDRGDLVMGYTDQGFEDQWNNNFLCFYTYDENHNMLTAEQATWYADQDQWFSTMKWENVYDENGNMLTQTYFNRWMGSSDWTKGSQFSWEYDEAGNLTRYAISMWSDYSGQYSPYIVYDYTYDENGNKLSEILTQYDNPSYYYIYTYDENNNMLSFTHQKWNGTDWYNYMLVDYTYDDQNRQTQAITQLWNNEQWELSQKSATSYFEFANITTYYSYDAETESWKSKSNYVIRRNADGQVEWVAYGEWMDKYNNIQTQRQELYTYNNGLLTNRKEQVWNDPELKFDDVSDMTFGYNDDRNCINVTAAAKQSKEWIFAPYNDTKDQWDCPDFEPMGGDITYLNVNDYVEPTGISLDVTEIMLEPEYTQQLKATVLPENVSNPEYYWTSSNEDVARVSVNGKVYAIAEGEATITAYTLVGNFSAECIVSVGDTSGIDTPAVTNCFSFADGLIRFNSSNEDFSLSVYDISGKAMVKNSCNNEISTIGWNPGLYIVKTLDGKISKTYKIIVK
ncbi:MAG: Ig-like domain-containing protein [Lepagella sp.]